MNRRRFLTAGSAAGLTLLAGLARSDRDGGMIRIGVLVPPVSTVFEAPLREGLRELGYVDGKNVALVVRQSSGSQEEWRGLADDLVRAKVDLIMAVGTPAARAAMDATQTIPVVFGVGDALNSGLAASLARPGRNGTGIATQSTELSAKRLELLHQLVPTARRVAYLYNPATPLGPRMRDEVVKAAPSLRVQVDPVEARNASEIDVALQSIRRTRPDGVLVSSEVLFLANRARIIQALNEARLPVIYPWRAFVTDGGVVSYGPRNEDGMRRMALYADRILKGAKPGDLPVEQLSNFHLVIDLKAAKAQGLPIPEAFRVMADEVVR